MKPFLFKKTLLLSTFFILFFIFLYFFNTSEQYSFNKSHGQLSYEKAKVLEVLSENLHEYDVVPGLYTGTQEIEVKILTGPKKNQVYQIQNNLSRIYNVHAKEGMTLIVSIDETASQMYPISVFSYNRSIVLYSLTFIFFALLIFLGGKKGLKSVFALVFTLICVIFLFLPLLFRGYSPILSALFITILTTLVTLFMLNGWCIKTLCAVLGTTGGLIIAGLLAYICGDLAHISTINTPEAETLMNIATDTTMQVKGILFAGILIASLGAVMDLGMSIASTLFELYSVNHKMSAKALFTSGMNIGKDMMGTMSNTLILAFTGGSLNTLILLYAYQMPYYQLMNIDYLAIELIQGLCGSIGVVLTVPITAFISAFCIHRYSPSKSKKRAG